MSIAIDLIVVISLLMSVQAAYTVYLILYTWDHDADYEAARPTALSRASDILHRAPAGPP